MLSGKCFVIAGLSRLTVRVAESLVERNATVVVITDSHGPAADELFDLLPEAVRVQRVGRDRDQALVDAGVMHASSLLAVSDDDLENLRFAADAHAVAPDIPIVLRTFQPELADHLSSTINIRRAYSVAALAAPAFVAASFSESVVETLRLADEEIPLCVLDVNTNSPLAGRTLDQIKDATSCGIVAVDRGDTWVAASSDERPIAEDDRVLVGGRHGDVLQLASQNSPHVVPTRRARGRAATTRARQLTSSLLPVSALIFAIVFTATVIVNAVVFDLDLTDAMSVALSAALGGSTPPTGYEWVQIFNMLSTIAGTILLWILLSHITALVLAERFEEHMNKRARRMRNHIVVVGLGKVGYRVVQALDELGVPTVAIEKEPDSRFVDAVALHTPVLTGDGQLAENLERCGIEHARCVIACSNDDLANLAACLEARDLQPNIRTIARVFDESLATRLGKAFLVDVALSSTTIAASAFVGAAADALAMRPITLDGLELLAFRFRAKERVERATIDEWRRQGLRVLAIQHADGAVEPPTAALYVPFEVEDEAIVVGPAQLVRDFASTFSSA